MTLFIEQYQIIILISLVFILLLILTCLLLIQLWSSIVRNRLVNSSSLIEQDQPEFRRIRVIQVNQINEREPIIRTNETMTNKKEHVSQCKIILSFDWLYLFFHSRLFHPMIMIIFLSII